MKNFLAFKKEEIQVLSVLIFLYWLSFIISALHFGFPLIHTLWTQTPYVLLDIVACFIVYRWICPDAHKNIGLLVLKQLGLFIIYFGCYRGLNNIIPEYNDGNPQIVIYSLEDDAIAAFIVLLTTIVPAYGLYYYKYGLYRAEKANEKKVQFAMLNEQLAKRELRYYKGEFNSHLTFNILTYLHSKAIKLPDLAEPILLLTEILRYNTAVESDKKVSLNTEIEYLSNFMFLNQLIHPHHYIKLEIAGRTENIWVYPRIIMGFVENAIKHGNASDPNFPIKVELVANESELQIQVTNKKKDIPLNNTTQKGLLITKTMLDKLYGEYHHLLIEDGIDTFKVNLEIKIKNETPAFTYSGHEIIS